MGLDVVELVIRCEEEFGVNLEYLPQSARSVGELFDFICAQLDLSDSNSLQPMGRQSGSHAIAVDEGASRDAVWARLVQLLADQFQVATDRITYTTRFTDLGAQ